MLSFINAGIIGAGATAAVLPMAAAYGGGAQLLAGMWAFRRGNTFAATAFTSYGAFWFSYYLLIGVWIKGVAPATVGPCLLYTSSAQVCYQPGQGRQYGCSPISQAPLGLTNVISCVELSGKWYATTLLKPN